MQTITKHFAIYEYSELEDNAKERVKYDYLDSCRDTYYFSDLCEYELVSLFPKSNLKVQYRLAYCQGDGFNIYGTICLDDLLELLKDKFTDKELRFLNWAFHTVSTMYKLPYNNHDCFCICDRHDYTEDIVGNLEWYEYRGIKYDILNKFNELAQKYMTELCKKFENDGYKYFYEIDDDEMEDISNANDWHYLSDGTFFVA